MNAECLEQLRILSRRKGNLTVGGELLQDLIDHYTPSRSSAETPECYVCHKPITDDTRYESHEDGPSHLICDPTGNRIVNTKATVGFRMSNDGPVEDTLPAAPPVCGCTNYEPTNDGFENSRCKNCGHDVELHEAPTGADDVDELPCQHPSRDDVETPCPHSAVLVTATTWKCAVCDAEFWPRSYAEKNAGVDSAPSAVLKAAEALVAKLNAVHDNLDYQGVWTVAHMHRGAYRGPTYTKELDDLKAALSDDSQPTPSPDPNFGSVERGSTGAIGR